MAKIQNTIKNLYYLLFFGGFKPFSKILLKLIKVIEFAMVKPQASDLLKPLNGY